MMDVSINLGGRLPFTPTKALTSKLEVGVFQMLFPGTTAEIG